MTENQFRRIAFWLFVIFIPAALIGGLMKYLNSGSGPGSILILIGMIGALIGFILLKIAGPPKKERK